MKDGVLKLPSFAKINWFLKVFGKREDGYHDICTAFQSISLRDTISFESSDDLVLACDDQRLPTDKNNLAIRAAEILRSSFGVNLGARITIEKRIPFPGGLGGGSSNAATVLLGLSVLWNLHPGFEELVSIAAKIGSDVPFFLYGGTALGSGRGTDIEPVRDLPQRLLLIAVPDIHVPTPEAYKSLGRTRLTSESAETNLIVCRELAERLISGSLPLENDFEPAVFRTAPEVLAAKDELISAGAEDALLSGSGASVFGIFDNDDRRQDAKQKLSSSGNLRVFAAETISRERFRQTMNPCGDLLPKRF
ncbi:MAG: 4-(cytidine 5'-diphospho)-2-C-methyl-D-erythritol kinase [Acidobacteria bacterium]|nr:MAG: 4-(cytidine 5'-diphospho)-2-C-methyl-D-erythritol kinase [Acidobacteriota bacterium]REK01303.1 MAG: 4-(cytidine 5'-diphospho)-2-C-methyl-D-erythritol kinase [Acidobacteriota bacterium]REK14259.1 MAG: 4-(cytidine 5'-diphospho)-2-C-methyl-D-erythritol kinase [Acidobacteriota bacterium]REK44974.1 MAG: 4-(cytidine 5'-diphospho)-2-C-methyl-D-erythritol kinase [Acidobacteriota bacterium]